MPFPACLPPARLPVCLAQKTKRRIFGIHTGKMTLAEDVNLEVFVMAKVRRVCHGQSPDHLFHVPWPAERMGP